MNIRIKVSDSDGYWHVHAHGVPGDYQPVFSESESLEHFREFVLCRFEHSQDIFWRCDATKVSDKSEFYHARFTASKASGNQVEHQPKEFEEGIYKLGRFE